MKKILTASALALATAAFAGSASADGHAIGACLITKTDTNPFFVKMKEGATAKAEELGISLKSFAGKVDGDHETQVQAIETCIADGAKGFGEMWPRDTNRTADGRQNNRRVEFTILDADGEPLATTRRR